MQEGKGHDADWCWVIDPLDGTQTLSTVSLISVFLSLYNIKA